MHLTLVIPAYNEARRIGGTLRLVQAYLSKQPFESEIVVVDDGSDDDTLAVARNACATARLVRLDRNQGKGHAVKVGMLAGTGAYRAYYDADASTPITELAKFWPRFADGADVVIGSRSMTASEVEVRQPRYRETMGRIFNVFVRTLILRGYPDTQCGFKGFTASACERLFPLQRIARYSFDTELLYIAHRLGLRIDAVPIRWINCPHSRVHPIFDAARMLYDLTRIRWNALCGRYTASPRA